mgnify:CR=1 FL=1
MAEALYRKYRSKRLSEVVGQSHITDLLQAALSQDKTSHAYLFTGPRGVGKTSVARILAHDINRLTYDGKPHLDIIEIDAASNNSVEDIRDLREKVSIAPVSATKKIYIIDEVHMLSKPAFNALLKTLEEPPAHVVFILATTEVHKIPETILSRTQRFHFRPIATTDMLTHLRMIAKKESIKIDDQALELIAMRAQGSFRDAISLLDQLKHSASSGTITKQTVEENLGLAPQTLITDIAHAIDEQNVSKIATDLKKIQESGISATIVAEQLMQHTLTHLPEKPELVELVDGLLDVQRSVDPFIKLLVTLAKASHREQSSPQPADIKPAKNVALAATQKIYEVAPEASPPQPKKKKKPSSSTSKKASLKSTHAIDWPAILEAVRSSNMALYSIIKRSDATVENGTLLIHFAYGLHQKKVESEPYRTALSEITRSLYGESIPVSITSGKRPPKNEQARAVAAIMGGGEEVYVKHAI